MADIYALRALVTSDGLDGVSLLHRLARDVVEWLSGQRRLKQLQPPVAFTFDTPIEEPFEWTGDADGHCLVRIDRTSLPDQSAESWRLRWEQPDTSVPRKPVRWTTEVRLSAIDEVAELDVQTRVVADGSKMISSYPPVAKPRFVSSLLANPVYNFSIDGWRIDATPEFVTYVNVKEFVNNILLNPRRRLPVIIISPDEYSKPLLDPHRLADALAGVATVGFIEDPAVTYEWTELVGGRLQSVFRGAIREYWPDFRVGTADFYSHRLWLPSDILRLGQSFPGILFDRLTQLTGRYFDGLATYWQRVQHLAAAEQRARLTSRAREIGDAKAAEELIDWAQVQIDRANREKDDLQKANDELSRRLMALEEELAQQKRQWNVFKANQRSSDDTAQPISMATVLDAVRTAQNRFSRLRFLPSAESSAKDSPYQDADSVLKAFEQLNELATLRADAGTIGCSIGDWLADYGIEYVAKESQTTMSRYGSDRTFSDGERYITMEEHVKFGQSHDPRECLRIHISWDTAAQGWVIGWVGKHLRIASTN